MSDNNKKLDELQKKSALLSGASWVKFPNVGDTFQGTLITRRLGQSPTGQEQIIYVLKNEDGLWNLAFKSNYPIHKDFANAVVGQVIRVVFSSEKKHAQKGFNPIKIYTVVTEAGLVDEESRAWLSENGYELGESLPELVEETSSDEEDADEDDSPAAPARSPIGPVTRSK